MRKFPYYTDLKPFREVFRQGQPILTYHHVGLRPRGAALKGLYVSPKLFAQQMAELQAAGFVTTDYGEVTAAAVGDPPRVFITFDDGFRDVLDNALPVLRERKCTSIQFIVADLIGKSNEWQQREGDVAEPLMDDAQIRDWLAAGQQIGSHTLTHPWLSRISPAAAREEIFGSKRALEDKFGRRIDHFCYPYGDWNEAVQDLVMEAGYRTACITKRGVNTPAESPFALKRFTARYPSRSLKSIWKRLWQ